MMNIFTNIRYRSFALIFGVLFISISCEDFFETPLAENVTNETIYSSMTNAERGLNAAYYAIPYNWAYGSTAIDDEIRAKGKLRQDIIASICDEAVSSSTWSGAIKAYYGSGVMDPLTVGLENTTYRLDLEYIFEEPYYYIRYAYLFLESVDSVPDATEQWLKEKKAEAKLLIAISWYELIRRHGSVPYVNSTLSANDDFSSSLDRPALIDLINDVDELIVDAIADAPDKIAESDASYGRVTKATAYFLRSRLWLLAASPIFNTDTPYSTAGLVEPNEICLGYAEGSDQWREVWQKAADYSLAAIEYCHQEGYYMSEVSDKSDKAAVVEAYREVFRGVVNNPEIIQFSRRVATLNGSATGSHWIGRNMPPSQSKNWGSHGFCNPNQGFIKQMIRNLDGSELTFGAEGGNNPWANADYRFEANVVYDGCDWGEGTTMTDHPYSNGYETTGYFLRKFMHDEWQIGTYSVDVPYYYMRLPELYLNYAEALCELDYSANRTTIQYYLNMISARVGAFQVDLTGFSEDEVRQEIRREKAVEFMFEDQRFFDVKRWLIADQTIGATKYAIVRQPSSATYTSTTRYYEESYDVAQMTSRQTVWNDKYYLMPFPSYEILKDMGLNQNPGY